MSKIETFQELDCWQEARELSGKIYEISSTSAFKNDYSLRDQVRRSANSVVLNIAEGFGRRTDQEFIKFLVYAHGSVNEVQAALYLANDQQYISKETLNTLLDQYEELSKMLSGFISYLKQES